MGKIRAVIIDDENNAVDFVKALLEQYFPEIEICGVAYTGKQGVEMIKHCSPDLIFLDVEMPQGNGFYVLEQCKDSLLKVIFITAYNQYALKAIKFSAVDYLLKPINVSEFKQAVQKALQLDLSMQQLQQQYAFFMQNLQGKQPQVLAIPISEGYEYLSANQIVRVEAERSYCTFFLESKRKITVSRSMGEYQEMLMDKGFFRTHNSHLINLAFVAKYSKRDGGFIELKDKTQIPISRSKKTLFLEVMEQRSL